MDMFVPNLGIPSSQYTLGAHSSIYDQDNIVNMQCTVSPHSSVYDSDKTDLNVFCDEMTPFSNAGFDAGMDDLGNLDDSIENSNLNFFTESIVSSLKVSAPEHTFSKTPSADPVKPVVSSCDVGLNPTLAQLNMDAISMDDVLNLEKDSKFDDIFNTKSSSGYRPVSQSQPCPLTVERNSSCASSVSSSGSLVSISSVSVPDAWGSLGNNFTRKSQFFPPRQANPPLVGVVTPVKQSESAPVFIKQEPNSLKPAPQTAPFLHELLRKKSPPIIKPEPCSTKYEDKMAKLPISVCSGGELPAQIVPTSKASRKRDSNGNSKSEAHVSTSLGRDVSIDETWDIEDIESLIEDAKRELPAKRKRCDSGSSGHNSNNDDDDDDDDRAASYDGNNAGDYSDDDMSDIDEDLTNIQPGDMESLIPRITHLPGTKKQQKPVQFFWQYNVQAKGPKGTRLKLTVESPEDPHVLNNFEDPVFDECNTSIAGIRHGGKARKGDGNEITPNPRKLYIIGHQLARLNKKINACCLQISGPAGNGVSAAERSASRKEKNKLASRACRLKKKAQHEANKIKLHGLALEHGQLHLMSTNSLSILAERAKAILETSAQAASPPSSPACLTSRLVPQIDKSLDETEVKVAGQSIDYVNSIILAVEAGDMDGGLNLGKKRQHKS